MTLALGLCGCGVIGRRHLLGLAKLRAVGRLRFDLVGLADPLPENADRLADLAAAELGRRPRVFPSLATMRHAPPLDALPLDALDLTTAPNLHAELAIAALAAGLHVLVEKPIALTVREGARMVAAAVAAGRRLAVAENYRRDPVNRLARALLDAGAVGRPFLAIQSSSGAGGRVIITPWRHRRRSGGIAVDMGVHYADLLEYFLGPAAAVVGMGAVVDRERRDDAGVLHPADAEDLTLGLVRFASGALASLTLILAGRGADHFRREISGTAGTLTIPPDRSGRPLALTRRANGHDPTPSPPPTSSPSSPASPSIPPPPPSSAPSARPPTTSPGPTSTPTSSPSNWTTSPGRSWTIARRRSAAPTACAPSPSPTASSKPTASAGQSRSRTSSAARSRPTRTTWTPGRFSGAPGAIGRFGRGG